MRIELAHPTVRHVLRGQVPAGECFSYHNEPYIATSQHYAVKMSNGEVNMSILNSEPVEWLYNSVARFI